MKSLFYITGKQATGKSRNVGVVSQIYSSSQKNDLQIMSKNEGIQFFNIKL